MTASMRLSWFLLALAVAHVLVGIGLAVAGDWTGGVFYVLLYAVPLLLIGYALRSLRAALHTAAGWAAVVLALYFAAIPIGNWAGYSSGRALFVVLITLPTIAVYLAVVWFTLLHRSRRPGTPHPAS
jgi:hypothetical protein